MPFWEKNLSDDFYLLVALLMKQELVYYRKRHNHVDKMIFHIFLIRNVFIFLK